MKLTPLILCALCLATGVRPEHGGQALMRLAQPKRAPLSAVAPTLPTNAPVTRAFVHPLPVPIPNVTVSWTLSTNWLAGEPALTLGTGTNRATLNVSVLLSNLVTGLVTVNGAVITNLPYQQSNRVVLPVNGAQQFRAFHGPKSK